MDLHAAAYSQAYERAVDRASRLASRRLRPDDAAARASALLAKERRQHVAGLRRLDPAAGLDVVAALSDHCRQLFRCDPEAALRAAAATVEAAQALGAYGTLRTLVYDARALAWGLLANAHRVVEDYAPAERCWRQSERSLERGTGDPFLQAQLLDLQGSLRRDQQRFEEASDLFREAQGLFLSILELPMAGRSGVNRGLAIYYAGRIDESIQVTATAARWVDPRREPVTAIAALHNLAAFVAEAGASRSALCLLEDGGLLYAAGSTTDQLRGLWLRGRLHAALGEWPLAERCLGAVHRGFRQGELWFDAALSGLELAVTLLHLDQPAEVGRLAEELLPVFVAKEIPREASASLLLFVEAARRQATSAEQAEALVAELKAQRGGRGFLT